SSRSGLKIRNSANPDLRNAGSFETAFDSANRTSQGRVSAAARRAMDMRVPADVKAITMRREASKSRSRRNLLAMTRLTPDAAIASSVMKQNPVEKLVPISACSWELPLKRAAMQTHAITSDVPIALPSESPRHSENVRSFFRVADHT